MSHRTLDCLACSGSFTVDDDQEGTRCPSCGTKYAPPWDAPEVLSSPLDVEPGQPATTGPEPRPAPDGGQPMTLDVDGGTVEIVIRVRRG